MSEVVVYLMMTIATILQTYGTINNEAVLVNILLLSPYVEPPRATWTTSSCPTTWSRR